MKLTDVSPNSTAHAVAWDSDYKVFINGKQLGRLIGIYSYESESGSADRVSMKQLQGIEKRRINALAGNPNRKIAASLRITVE